MQDFIPTTSIHIHRSEAAVEGHPLLAIGQMFGRAKATLRRALANDIAVDLGTSNTVIFVPEQGIVLNEPSVIAYNEDSRKIIAVGNEAKVALGREGRSIKVVRPLKDGVIADFDAAELMLSLFLRAATSRHRFSNPRMLICSPCEISQVERRAFEDAAGRAGAKSVHFVEQPIAAAIGAGFDMQSGRIFMLIDIGGGTTDIAVLGFGGPIHMSTLRVGGCRLDQAIGEYVRHTHYVELGELTAEAVKIGVGSVAPVDENRAFEIAGRDLRSGLPTSISITAGDLRRAMEPVLEEIIRGIQATMEDLSAEVAAGLIESGIAVTGGGAQLGGLIKRISDETGVNARRADCDLQTVAVMGAGSLIQGGKTRWVTGCISGSPSR